MLVHASVSLEIHNSADIKHLRDLLPLWFYILSRRTLMYSTAWQIEWWRHPAGGVNSLDVISIAVRPALVDIKYSWLKIDVCWS